MEGHAMKTATGRREWMLSRIARQPQEDLYHHVGLFEDAQTPWKRNHPSGTPRSGLWGIRSEPVGMIRLPLHFGDKAKARNLEHPAASGVFDRARTRRPPSSDKKQWIVLPPSTEALVIHTLALADPVRSRLKAIDDIEKIPLDERRLDRTVQLGLEMEAATRRSLVNLLEDYRHAFVFGPEEMPRH
ncbi:hypothetical protein Cgig2_032288 [Carnegiea gigantea]|uniref:Uncharacterized protein n=1 Tax=Carnegiea gigantea TaxID=171969 RepID=A0A9Q1JJM9_9CARY|nr:hypothetical protein Cgig2_032288 [Carnegiea gigantea]